MNLRRLAPMALPALPLLLLLPLNLHAQQRYNLAGEAAIYDLVGNVRLEAGSGPDVVVRVQTAGKDAGRLRVETGSVGAWKTLRVIFPERDIIYDDGEHDRDWGSGNRSTITVRENGTFLDQGFWRDEAGVGAAADELLHSPDHKVYLRSRGDGLDARADLVVEVPRARRVAVFVGGGRIEASNVDGTLRIGSIMGDISLQGLRGALTARTISADLRLGAMSGKVDGSTISGGVTLEGARDGSFRLHSISGGIHARDVTGEEVELTSTSGDVAAHNVAARTTELSSTSGSVEATFTSMPQQLRARSISGNVGVSLPERAGARVHMSTVSGNVESAFPLTVRGRIGRVV